MAATPYLVTIDRNSQSPRKNGVDAAVVVAENSTEAKQMAASVLDGEGNAPWTAATATALAAAANLDGFVMNVQIFHPTTNARVANASFTGVSGATIDTIGTGIAAALNALSNIAGAAYNTGTNVLTVAETTDALGDHTFVISLRPPTATHADPQNLTSWFTSHVDGGVGSAALAVTLAALSFPKVFGMLKQV
jgi:hypothetical protein